MAIRVALHHRTFYRYPRPIALYPHIVRLRPAPHCRALVQGYSLKVRPSNHFINWQQDPQSNFLARLVFPQPTNELLIDVDLVVEMVVINPFDFFLEAHAEHFPFHYEKWLSKELAPYLETEPVGPRLRDFVALVDRREQKTIDFLVALNQRLQREIRYLVRMAPGVQTPEQTLELGSGSCRDTGWLMVQVLRNLGLAARFVSGYLIQLAPDVRAIDGPSGPTADFTDLHAWVEVYLPGAGWVGFDPTSGLLAGEGHIPLAATPDPGSAAPITGGHEASDCEFGVEMRLVRLDEQPRVTRPYTEQQWQAIDTLGRQIDEQLRADDVRLTMGGEPTFVSIDDMDGEEWNFTALGENKTRLAEQLIRRLREQFAAGGLLLYGQGKWYPGESLPRWAMGCYWRADGVPIWGNDALLADTGRDYGFGLAEAERFLVALTRRLRVGRHNIHPAFEDAWHYLKVENALPVNVTPLDSRLDDVEQRERLQRLFERGLNQPAGYVLPLKADSHGPDIVWHSQQWKLRTRHLTLIPGDSPIGLRLPLSSLPWIEPPDYPHLHPVDPFAPRPPLPVYERRPASTTADARATIPPPAAQPPRGAGSTPSDRTATAEVVRTALCVEPRQGRLYVFMPPTRTIEEYLHLVAAIEDTAAELALPVVVEGEPPPHDHRLPHIKATPDPGVIEVNMHPAASWEALVHNTTTLYEQARQSRLGAEKFMLDGRHTGTGGGNHILLGGPTPADSPFLRRPDLLRSFLAYWVNHPALSYLFSGLFVGPTSQAPRVDEARHDSLYELEIAFDQVPAPGGYIAPWLVDRLLRNLLTDTTGNTHRAEFCIDKLYAPETARGRLGLVEFRALEMPPHAQMSLTQHLLLRALTAWFWRQPYEKPLIRWGTQLHDKFMLPHFVVADFADVINDLRRAGYPLDPQWFAAHIEFRFPLFGRVVYHGITLELRQAIEPWHVLGEEPGAGGTVRYTDSSVERLQVLVSGLVAERHIVTCNGRRVPLQPTGTQGQSVGGVRFRAWQPPACLHPTIPVHAPLVFDLVDTWSGRSVGGCTYHVGHPGGRNFERFPINANEAEARRIARFEPFGHTPGVMGIPPVEYNSEFPCTLDLRRGRR